MQCSSVWNGRSSVRVAHNIYIYILVWWCYEDQVAILNLYIYIYTHYVYAGVCRLGVDRLM